MTRRQFIHQASALGYSPFFVNGLVGRTFDNLALPAALNQVSDRCIVLIELKGGNDGLNSLIPLNQYDLYRGFRPRIGISDSGKGAFMALDNTQPETRKLGLHPSLGSFKNWYDSGKMAVVQGVGYPDTNLSHFKSTDLWLTGGDGTPANSDIKTGWMGRYLVNRFPDGQYTTDTPTIKIPTPNMSDPLGIQLGDVSPSMGFRTDTPFGVEVNLTGQNPAGYYSLLSSVGAPPLNSLPNTDYGRGLRQIMNIEESVMSYAQRITDVFKAGSNAVTYPDSDLAQQLKTVARFLRGGSKTQIFLTHQSTYDTHSGQIQANAPHLGAHAVLLTDLSAAIGAFLNDLGSLGLADRVIVATFSEFGRRVSENTNWGTEHGTTAPMLVFGNRVQPGVLGNNANLALVNSNNGFQLQDRQFDYRQVFGTLLKDWLGAPADVMAQTFRANYSSINLVRSCGERLVAVDKPIVPPLYQNTSAYTIEGSSSIGSGTNVTFNGEKSVTLKPGFKTEPGAVFSAKIGGCD